MEKTLILTAWLILVVASAEAARFRHPLTVPDMESFASPYQLGGFSGPGSPDRYSMANRYAYRMRGASPSIEDEEPVASALKALKIDPEEESQADQAPQNEPAVYRRNDPYIRQLRRERELNALYDKIAREFPFLVQQGLYTPGQKLSLDHLLGMTIFGQPKMGRK